VDPEEVLDRYVKDEAMREHLLVTGRIMEALARRLGEDVELWRTTGLLHDIDYEIVGRDMKRHGLEGARILRELGFPEELCRAVERHNLEAAPSPPETKLERALVAADQLAGLLFALKRVVPSRSYSGIRPKTVKKKFKDKSFARAVRRDHIRWVEDLGIGLSEFFALALEAVKDL